LPLIKPIFIDSFLEIIDQDGKIETATASDEFEDSNDPDSPRELLKQLFA
jgi:hypothetical protein